MTGWTEGRLKAARRWGLPLATAVLALTTVMADTQTDSRIREKILGRLSGQVALHLEQFQLDVTDGVVTIGGSVASIGESQRLERLLYGVPGVVGLSSSVVVRPSTRTEAELEAMVRRVLERRPRFRKGGLVVTASGSVVTLSGKLDLAIDRLEAGEFAADVEGVTEVINTIEILPTAPVDEEQIRKRVVSVLTNPLGFGVVRDLQVEVAGARVTLKGTVSRELDRREAERLVLGVKGVASVQNDLEVVSP